MSSIWAVYNVVDCIGLGKCKEHREETWGVDYWAAEAERSEWEWRQRTEVGSAASAGSQRWTIKERGRSLLFPQRPAHGCELGLGFLSATVFAHDVSKTIFSAVNLCPDCCFFCSECGVVGMDTELNCIHSAHASNKIMQVFFCGHIRSRQFWPGVLSRLAKLLILSTTTTPV